MAESATSNAMSPPASSVAASGATDTTSSIGKDDIRKSLQALQAYRLFLSVQFLGALALIAFLVFSLMKVEAYNQREAASAHGLVASAPATSDLPKKNDVAPNPLPIFLCVILVGMLGALISALQRLYKIESLPAALVNPLPNLNNWHFFFYSLIPPVIGMVSAAFFYVLSETGWVQGPMLASFKCTIGDCNGSMQGLLAYSPVAPSDYAKALVLGFLAGFAERLLPDTLASLEATLRHKD